MAKSLSIAGTLLAAALVLSPVAQGNSVQVELLPAGDTLYIRAEDASVTEVLESIAEAMNADIIGIETLETEERVSCDLEIPLIRALAWLAPHQSYAVFWGARTAPDLENGWSERMRIVFFPEGQDAPRVPARRRAFRNSLPAAR